MATFEDTESGGYYLTRAGLQKALEHLEEGQANVLICKDLVRLTRNERAEQAAIFDRITKAGGRAVFWDAEYDSSPLGQFSLNVAGDFAILEKAVIKDRTMRGRRRRAAEGIMPAQAIAPFGYIIPKHADITRGTYQPEHQGKYLIDEERAQIAAQIFARYASGSSLHDSCKWLQSAGVPTSAGGRHWYPTNINSILTNPAYYGKAAFGRFRTVIDKTRRLRGLKRRDYKEPVPESEWTYIDCPAIVSKEVWDRCQQNRSENRARLSTRIVRRQLLTGMMRCPRCHRVMTGRGSHQQRVGCYKCKESSPSTNSSGTVCWHKNLNAPRIEALVLQAIEQVIEHPSAIEAAYKHYHASIQANFPQEQYNRLKQELADLNRQELATVKAQVAGVAAGASTGAYESLLRELALRRTVVQGQVETYEKAHRSPRAIQDPGAAVAEMLADIHHV